MEYNLDELEIIYKLMENRLKILNDFANENCLDCMNNSIDENEGLLEKISDDIKLKKQEYDKMKKNMFQ